MRLAFVPAISGLALAWVLAGGVARAQSDSDRATARSLGEEATRALAAGDNARAEDEFRRADALFHAPTLVLGLARAQAAEKKYVEAWESYHRILLEENRSNAFFKKALESAAEEIKAVEPKRAHVTLRVKPLGSSLDAVHATLDGAPLRPEALGVPRLLDPGEHVWSAREAGSAVATVTFQVDEGATVASDLTLKAEVIAAPAPPPRPSSLARTLGYASFGLAAAGLVTGAVAGGVAIAKHGTLAGDHCGTGAEPPCSASAVSSYHAVGTVSDAGFAALGVFAVTGALLVALSPRDASSALGRSTTPWVRFDGAGVWGAF